MASINFFFVVTIFFSFLFRIRADICEDMLCSLTMGLCPWVNYYKSVFKHVFLCSITFTPNRKMNPCGFCNLTFQHVPLELIKYTILMVDTTAFLLKRKAVHFLERFLSSSTKGNKKQGQ